MSSILIVEDERSLLEMIALNLELEGFTVTSVANGKTALGYVSRLGEFDLVILDVMLPEVSGLDICRAYRQQSSVPILFLSAKGTTIDRIAGLKLGANDYLPKPFDLEELLLRVHNLLRGSERTIPAQSAYKIGELTIDFTTFQLTNEQHQVVATCTKREIELLQFFIQHKNRVVSRDELLNELWSNEHFPTGRTIDNYILNFRKLFEPDPKNPIYFHSIRGVGYKVTLED